MRFPFRRKKEKKKQVLAEQIRAGLGTHSIVMIGLMGCGKSAIGRRLAAAIELPFEDADTEIEKAAGMTISEIFATHGEDHFREREEMVIARLLNAGPKVLATGGGAFMSDETRSIISEQAISVWLQADLETLMERVSRRDHRPLLKTDNPRAVMQDLMQKRYPIYKQADITICSRNEPHEVIVNEIIEGLVAHLRSAPKDLNP